MYVQTSRLKIAARVSMSPRFEIPVTSSYVGGRLFKQVESRQMGKGRKHNIAALETQMRCIEQAVAAIQSDKAYLPSPHHMQALSVLRSNMKRIEADLSILEPQLWERVKKWQDNPYTPTEKRRIKAVSFIGWWFAGFAGLDYTIMGWLTPLFAEPWHRLIVSAVISLALVFWLYWSDKRTFDE